MHEFRTARAEDSGHADAVVAGELRDRRHGGETDAAAQHNDVLPGGIEQ